MQRSRTPATICATRREADRGVKRIEAAANASGRIDHSTVLESSSTRPSLMNTGRPAKTLPVTALAVLAAILPECRNQAAPTQQTSADTMTNMAMSTEPNGHWDSDICSQVCRKRMQMSESDH